MESRELIERLLNLSEAIEHAAQLADWPEAARRTEERSPLLMSLTGDVEDEMRNIIRRIQALDESVLTLAATGKEELNTEYQEALRRAAATRQYLRTARD